VQIHERGRKLDLHALGRRLSANSTGEIRHNEFLLRFPIDPYEITIFADGRAVIKGTKDPAVARSLYSRYVGA
jgi:adenylyltransferase/sulfurtransferase